MYVYLVPGFFGFVRLGSLNYFHGVSPKLASAFKSRGFDARIIECRTQPTGSIKNQADRLIQEVIDSGGLEAEEVHFVGHSTGGLNVRLLVTPGVRLRESRVEEKIGLKTRSVTTVTTPHYGTPLAGFFTSLQGRNILQLLTLMATTERGRRTLFLASRLVSAVAKADDFLGMDKTFLDELSDRVLRRLTLDPNDPIWEFLKEIARDQGAIIQLTPEGMHIFNAAVNHRPNVSYRCVIAATAPPQPLQWRTFKSVELAAMTFLYTLLYKLTAREHRQYPYPSMAEKIADEIASELPFEFTSETNDGIVPTMSQVSGELLDVVIADHLDIVGQFTGAGGKSRSDWLPSGSGFDEERFANVWEKIGGAIVESSKSERSVDTVSNSRD
ncbi:MAG: hypothetical protein QNJ97_11515 [Myxococcota bacterium]|nr:hypothetical protein [Myxococcota bacterium]